MEKPGRNVKELLISAKDTSELMVDLAYAAVFFQDEEIVEEVMDLEKKMGEAIFGLQTLCILAGRSPEDAQQVSGILHMANLIEKVGDEAAEIAKVISKRLGIPEELLADLRHAEEVVGRIPVKEGSPLQNRSLEELDLPREIGVWVMAIRRDEDWLIGPEEEEVLLRDDVLFVQGSEEGLDRLGEMAGIAPRPPFIPSGRVGLPGIERAVDLLVEMKNLSEAAVNLAYSALLFKDRSLAAEVADMEDRSDEMQVELESWVLHAAREHPQPENLRGLLHLSRAVEAMLDASKEMTRLVEQERPLHPVIAAALSETEEVVMRAVIEEGSEAEGMSLRQISLKTKLGLSPLAIQRGRLWICRPRGHLVLQKGDVFIATAPPESEEELRELCAAPQADPPMS